MDDILKRLEHEPSYCENCDAKQLRRDAADEIRRLQSTIEALELASRIAAARRVA